MKIKYLLLLTVNGAILALDQVTKLLIHTRFQLGESVSVIQDFFDITYVRNQGAAFGIFAQFPASFREPFFTIVPLFAIFVILMIVRKTPDSDRLNLLALSLICAGAIGNFIDRWQYKFVIDFLDFHYKEVYHFPAFNVADSAIVVGVGIMLLLILKQKNEAR